MRPILALTMICVPLMACGDDGGATSGGFSDRQVVTDFADQVVIPTYRVLRDRTAALDTALATLATTLTVFFSGRNKW